MTALVWDEERIAKLKELWETGISTQQIADALGGNLTKNAVIGAAYRLRLTRHSNAPKHGGRPPKPKPVVKVAAAATSDGCRWPIGHPGEAGFHFCGHAISRVSYCAEHAAKAYRAPDRPAEP